MVSNVALGRLYRSPVCGAELLVVKAASQALDAHCCNTAMKPTDKLVDIYHCKQCGSEKVEVTGGREMIVESIEVEELDKSGVVAEMD